MLPMDYLLISFPDQLTKGFTINLSQTKFTQGSLRATGGVDLIFCTVQVDSAPCWFSNTHTRHMVPLITTVTADHKPTIFRLPAQQNNLLIVLEELCRLRD